MERHNAAGHIVDLDIIETSFKHHLLERLLIGMFANGFNQVLITRFIIGNQLAYFGNDIKGIQIIDLFK